MGSVIDLRQYIVRGILHRYQDFKIEQAVVMVENGDDIETVADYITDCDMVVMLGLMNKYRLVHYDCCDCPVCQMFAADFLVNE